MPSAWALASGTTHAHHPGLNVAGAGGAAPGHVGGNDIRVRARQLVHLTDTGVLAPARHVTSVPTNVIEVSAADHPTGVLRYAPGVHSPGKSLGCLAWSDADRYQAVLAVAVAQGVVPRAQVVSSSRPVSLGGQQYLISIQWTGTLARIAAITAALTTAQLHHAPTCDELLHG